MFLCLAWIGAVLLVGGLVWFLTQSYRTGLLIEAVNKTFAQNGDSRRIERLPSVSFSLSPSSFGVWFGVVNSDEKVFVFTLARNGIAAACAALTDSSGTVKTIVPLSGNAAQILEELPLPIYRFYTARIERATGLRRGR
jgi:hypothetical protein